MHATVTTPVSAPYAIRSRLRPSAFAMFGAVPAEESTGLSGDEPHLRLVVQRKAVIGHQRDELIPEPRQRQLVTSNYAAPPAR